jgi:hypothetical protein
MAIKPPYSVERENRDWVIRVNSDVIDRDKMSDFLDYLVVESLREQSGLTEDDADALAREVKQGAWERVRHLFEER